MRVLHLTLKKQWFDMIKCGMKNVEYREVKPYWTKRLGQDYDAISFRNGYRADSPSMLVEYKGLALDYGNPRFGAPTDKKVYCLFLGRILSSPLTTHGADNAT